ncbi:hypothetical protein N7489_000212 [Penicillium chrysogenum]|uniref:Uncharacterized protein n=1 Tax=Penicillium chrysogenum TaxID=5076 RepID=A0ABQ8WI15_PENCH|nr:uncharacterized protein N7489_000212 [Penicillium chrysogenum]KAJ5249802.1 hypothetical protein N7489_000212 [Penicillium chrysogenum]KAJ5265414.1 hypothetical protein N7524_006432 [Penicillium chrysogenum]KAJ5268706.1 hypothetical protein N7505_004464 [Penicillium chrysogenum]KAJ6148585.1 hypothetical protein N7497_010567 [Penicillium chrysogenum]
MKYPRTELGTSPAAEHAAVPPTWKEASPANTPAAVSPAGHSVQSSPIKISHYRGRMARTLYAEAARRPVQSALKISRGDSSYGVFPAIINTMRNA